MDTFILHILPREAWQQAQAAGLYEPPSLQTEGFIHCSTAEQVAGTADRYFRGQHDLLLLHIDVTQLAADVLYELAPGTQRYFPHIYGALNLDAVARAEPFETDINGLFQPPTRS
jgi:uncharacterized protein (DUF952 family)